MAGHTDDLIREAFNYDPDTGILSWKVIKYSRKVGMVGSLKRRKDTSDRYEVKFHKKVYQVARVAWFIHHKYWPVIIDHISGNALDNRLLNLREVTPSGNMMNKARPRNNKTGCAGVSFDKETGKYKAVVKGKTLGRFSEKKNAISAVMAARNAFGFHKNHGRAYG